MTTTTDPITRRCGCRDVAGRLLDVRCPRLAEREHGSWSFRVDVPGPGGKRRQVRRTGFPTKAAARAEYERLRVEVRDGMHVDTGKVTVGQWLDEWLAGRGKIRETTRASYTSHIECHLRPHLGHVQLSALRATHIEAAYREIVAGNAARLEAGKRATGPATIARVHATLRAALNTAVRRRMIPQNVASYVELPSSSRPPVVVWLPADVGAFLDRLDATADRLGPLFHLVIAAGLRRGEACALRWADVDLDRGSLRISRSRSTIGFRVVEGAPKTKGSARTLSLDAGTVAVLRAHRKAQAEGRLAWGGAWVDTDGVFVREDGELIHPEHVSNRFAAVVKAAGLPRIRFHDLRHTSATLGLAAGESMKEISDRLGHSTIGITADTYTHVLPAVAQESAERRAALVPRALCPPRAHGASEDLSTAADGDRTRRSNGWGGWGSNPRPTDYESAALTG